jgi:diguanylate cyclase (GGDEF)-like protein
MFSHCQLIAHYSLLKKRMSQADFEAALEQLREEYLHNLPNKIADVTNTWQTLRDNAWDPAQFQTLTRLAHSLAGSGATYGFHAVSQAARALEQYCKSVPSDTSPLREAQAEIERLLARLQQTLSLPELSKTPAREPEIPSPPALQYVMLYEPDVWMAQEIETQLEMCGYRVARLKRLDALSEPGVLPMAVILDWDAAQADPHADLTQIHALHQTEPVLPILFVSARDDLLARLEAVRSGATGYLTAPLSTGSLIETLDTQTANRSSDPFRILIVEDDWNLAARSAAILEEAGMVSQIITDPLLVMPPLVDFRPDLILSDMHMPHLSGLELAAILRQQEAYVGIPIVFLSSETDRNTQLSAMLLGGDDFLVKPIEAHHLVGKVTSRVQRARTLRQLAERDSLTRLLNHTRFQEHLNIAVARAQRIGSKFALAMLDIDHFKNVNDTYGHPAGDRVLKNLARLLVQRLRKSDVVGRYGGEEFALILLDTDISGAYQLLEELRRSFEQAAQFSAGREFHVTFSGGIATLPPYEDAAALREAADRALYQAKRGGRNQIVFLDE